MAAEQDDPDFVIALRVINGRGQQLSTYFGKIRGMPQAGDRLARREGLIEIRIDQETYPNVNRMELFNRLSSLGIQRAIRSEAHFREVLDEFVDELCPGPPCKKKGGRTKRNWRSQKNRTRRTRRRQSRRK
jgi:hypothetical protein